MKNAEQPVSEQVKTDSELDATIDVKLGLPVVFSVTPVIAAKPRVLGGYEILDEILLVSRLRRGTHCPQSAALLLVADLPAFPDG